MIRFSGAWGDDEVFGFSTGVDKLDFSAIKGLDLIDLDIEDYDPGCGPFHPPQGGGVDVARVTIDDEVAWREYLDADGKGHDIDPEEEVDRYFDDVCEAAYEQLRKDAIHQGYEG